MTSSNEILSVAKGIALDLIPFDDFVFEDDRIYDDDVSTKLLLDGFDVLKNRNEMTKKFGRKQNQVNSCCESFVQNLKANIICLDISVETCRRLFEAYADDEVNGNFIRNSTCEDMEVAEAIARLYELGHYNIASLIPTIEDVCDDNSATFLSDIIEIIDFDDSDIKLYEALARVVQIATDGHKAKDNSHLEDYQFDFSLMHTHDGEPIKDIDR